MKIILEKHKDLLQALEKGDNEKAASLIDSISLHWAVSSGHKKIAELLIAKGADVNVNVPTFRNNMLSLLAETALRADETMVKVLIAYGADVNFSHNRMSFLTPIQAAVLAGNKNIVQLMISHGADLNKMGVMGFPPRPLEMAVYMNHHDIADLLKKHGAKRGGRNKSRAYRNDTLITSFSDLFWMKKYVEQTLPSMEKKWQKTKKLRTTYLA